MLKLKFVVLYENLFSISNDTAGWWTSSLTRRYTSYSTKQLLFKYNKSVRCPLTFAMKLYWFSTRKLEQLLRTIDLSLYWLTFSIGTLKSPTKLTFSFWVKKVVNKHFKVIERYVTITHKKTGSLQLVITMLRNRWFRSRKRSSSFL